MQRNSRITLAGTALLAALFMFSCGKKEGSGTSFELLDPSSTGVNFVNIVPESDSLNQFTYHYLFNGGGVAAGDLDNDGLPELVFSGNVIAAKIYKNKGDFKFEDITEKSGMKTKGWMSGLTMADVNNDGFLDIYICRSGPGNNDEIKRNYLFINNKNLTFTESAKAWGVDDPGNGCNASFFDFDGDGDLDMYLGNHAEKFYGDIDLPYARGLHMDYHNQQHFYRNEGNKFTDISEAAGVKAMGYCLSATPADYNRDGLMDLYVCNDYHVPDYYYLNNGDGTFTESFKKYFKHSSTNSMGSDVADYNRDGWMDLFTVDMLAEDPRRFMSMMGPKDLDFINASIKNGYGQQYLHNNLQTNQGDGYFSDYGFLTGVARTDWSWSPLFADMDNDGLSDLHITNGYYRDVTNLDFILYQDRKEKQLGKKVNQADVLQRLPFEKLRNYMYRNTGNYGFENVTEAWGLAEPTLSTGSAYADLNKDGHLDLVQCNQGDPVFIYKNNAGGGNYLRLAFKGGKKNNRFGIGAKVIYEGDSAQQLFEMSLTHGYQSSSEAVVHIGLGNLASAKKITVVWPNGEFQELKDVKANQVLVLDENNASGKYDYSNKEQHLFREINRETGLDFMHQDQENPDFKREPLLPHRFTMLGPGSATGDVNGDGLQDLFIGNARESQGAALYLQTADGKLRLGGSQPWKSATNVDMMGCMLFDADGDGDNDLYTAAGGAEYSWPSPNYAHKIYFNDGKGNFAERKDALPDVNTSGSCVTAGDIDGDGDLDLFVGGRLTPGAYPMVAQRSYLLRNDNGRFTDITKFIAPELEKPGMVCAAIFSDFNNDNKLDLVLSGEWMPIVFLQNTGDKFVDNTGAVGTGTASGWFNSLISVDIDNDGDLDYIAGNKGNNSFIQAGPETPLKIYWTDLDKNGRDDIWITHTKNGKEWPLYQLDEMAKSYPAFINKKFNTYSEISRKTANEIFGDENMAKNQLRANYFSNVLLRNNGSGQFEMIDLPKTAQAGPIYGLSAADVDGNGFMDIMAVGNSWSPRVTHGRDDAYNGLYFSNTGGNLMVVNGIHSGFNVPGDAKGLVSLPLGNTMAFVATQNNGAALIFTGGKQGRFVPAGKGDIKAIVTLKKGGSRAQDLSYGSGYLSSSAPGVWINEAVASVEFVNSRGQKRKI